ncbi:transposase [Halalkalibacter lacteus]|uniref:transposase n=1 Tax=Halalkalibacter lacteus TaxID=3090663 RepID=UPI002FC6696A
MPAKHADRTQMGDLIDIDSDAIHLFDRGYIDYKQFDHLCFSDVRFITRLKKDAQVEVLSEQIPQADSPTVKDQEVFLGNSQNGTKMTHSLRSIQTHDSQGNVVIIVTNCWKIETFFKWMKQHLTFKTFYGKSENAVCNQIWVASSRTVYKCFYKKNCSTTVLYSK